MNLDVVIAGGTVIDGTGVAGRKADVGVRDGRIVAVAADLDANGADVIDATGRVVAPGFIDIHTHYDAQILWDPDVTPSSSHGVTTVVMGNCGFGIVPTRPEHRSWIVETLENVEGMSAEALEAGIDWTFESFPEYLDVLDRRPKRLNVAVLLGHSPLRTYVMGPGAERAATAAEIAAMRAVVDEALEAGALGFGTTMFGNHVGARGRPVPSRFADFAEVLALMEPLRQAGRGMVQVTVGPGMDWADLDRLAVALSRPVSGAGIFSGLLPPGDALEVLAAATGGDGEVWPQVSCRRLVMQLNLLDPGVLQGLPAFAEVMVRPRTDRAPIYRDPAWRQRAKVEIERQWGQLWSKVFVAETRLHEDLVGSSVLELARAAGSDPWDVLVELALEEDLGTRFDLVLANDDEVELGALLADRRSLVGLSDAGAHASQLCDACYSTYLLGHWVRDAGRLSLEEAIWKLTAQPAEAFGIEDRGVLRPGYAADITILDPTTVAPEPLRRVHDLPAGADRLVGGARGIDRVLVNGRTVAVDGELVPSSHPGALLRGGAA